MNVDTVRTQKAATQQEPPVDTAKKSELANRITAAIVGSVAAVGAFFALLLLGVPIGFAAVAGLVVGGILSAITYLYLKHKRENPDPVDPALKKINRECHRQLRQAKQMRQERKQREANREPEAVQSLQNAANQYEQKKAECQYRYQNRDLNNPIFKNLYDAEMMACESPLQLAFMSAVNLLQPDARARVLAPYQAVYGHLIKNL